LIQTGGDTLLTEVQKLLNSISDKEELPEKYKESIIVPIYRKGDETSKKPIIQLRGMY
jgi:hypothetical protein